MTGEIQTTRDFLRCLVLLTSSGIAALLRVSLVCAPLQAVSAQTIHPPLVIVAATISAEPASRVPFPIRVAPEISIPQNSFVRVRGLPPEVALSEGYSIAPGSWAIPITALANLNIVVPSALVGKFETLITLVTVDGTVLSEIKSTLVIAATYAASQMQANAAPSASATILKSNAPSQSLLEVHPPAPVMTQEDRALASRYLQKGDAMLAEGNVAPARLLYQRSAEMGLAEAAMALAGTYDAAEFPRLNVQGIEPDTKEAKRWYERARELGAEEADSRLRRLGRN
jgi:hypothetical protein